VRSDASTARGPIRIVRAELLDGDRGATGVFRTGEPMTVRIHYHAKEPVKNPQFAVDVHRADGLYCAGINTRMDGHDFGTVAGDGQIDLAVPQMPLLPGCYVISVGILHGASMTPVDLHARAYPFSVASESREFGIVHLDHQWDHRREAAGPAAAGDAAGRAAAGRGGAAPRAAIDGRHAVRKIS
jgi:lipopolysaccharide transport system ATP-binding protein